MSIVEVEDASTTVKEGSASDLNSMVRETSTLTSVDVELRQQQMGGGGTTETVLRRQRRS